MSYAFYNSNEATIMIKMLILFMFLFNLIKILNHKRELIVHDSMNIKVKITQNVGCQIFFLYLLISY
jgi:uncharacterized membrane protein YGL010W